MKEYKIIPQPMFSNHTKFEALLNNYARQGWAVKTVYGYSNNYALLEREKR